MQSRRGIAEVFSITIGSPGFAVVTGSVNSRKNMPIDFVVGNLATTVGPVPVQTANLRERTYSSVRS